MLRLSRAAHLSSLAVRMRTPYPERAPLALLAAGSNLRRRLRADVIFWGAAGCGTRAQFSVQYKKSVFSMSCEIPTIIVAPDRAFRDALESNLRPPAFRIITTKAKLRDIGRDELPRSELCLVVMECGERLGPHAAQIAELKQKNPLARVAIVGQRWASTEIESAFEAGANAYFAKATMSKEFMQAMSLITR